MDLIHEAGTSDPRVTGEYVRTVPGADGSVTLVGVVHDHPASTYRVRRIIREIEPDVLALELPPIALSLFEGYARSDREPPLFGGEMSVAIQAGKSAAVVGIDRPSGGFFQTLIRDLLRERPPPATIRNVSKNVTSATKHAIVCRIAAAVASQTGIRLEVDFPVEHETDRSDPPEVQARDERAQVRRSRAFMSAFQSADASRASQFEDATRERYMVDRLSELLDEGDVVAVVGIKHLDPLTERLSETASAK